MEPTEIGLFETKTHLSEIIKRVLAGESFYITRRGKRVAQLGPVSEEKQPLTRGCARSDGYRMAPDFDDPLEDLEEYQ